MKTERKTKESTAHKTKQQLIDEVNKLERSARSMEKLKASLTGEQTERSTSFEDKDSTYLIEGRYSISDLIDLENLRETLEKFSRATGFTSALVEYPSQEILISTGWRDFCTQFHRAFPESAKNCKELQGEQRSFDGASKGTEGIEHRTVQEWFG